MSKSALFACFSVLTFIATAAAQNSQGSSDQPAAMSAPTAAAPGAPSAAKRTPFVVRPKDAARIPAESSASSRKVAANGPARLSATFAGTSPTRARLAQGKRSFAGIVSPTPAQHRATASSASRLASVSAAAPPQVSRQDAAINPARLSMAFAGNPPTTARLNQTKTSSTSAKALSLADPKQYQAMLNARKPKNTKKR